MSDAVRSLPDFLIVPSVLLLDEEIKPLDGYVYAIVYWYTQQKLEKCIASSDTIASLLKSNKGSIDNSISRLVKKGYVESIYHRENHQRELVPLIAFNIRSTSSNDEEHLIKKLGGTSSKNESTQDQIGSENNNRGIRIFNNTFSKENGARTNGLKSMGQLLKEKVNSTHVESSGTQAPVDNRIGSEEQHYGVAICDALNIGNPGRGRVIAFIRQKKNGYWLHEKANELLSNQKFLSMTEDERIRYLFGAYKKSA